MLRFLINKIHSLTQQQHKYQPLINIKINKSALLNNFHTLQSLAPQWQIAPVIKSNAYGHGLTLVVNILKKEKNIPFFCVDSFFEARLIQNTETKIPILILGYTPTPTIQKNKLKNIFFTVGSLEQLQSLIKLKIHRIIHLKFDTGMHRRGILHSLSSEIIRILKTNTTIQIDGIMSHFAESNNLDSEFTELQIKRWNELVEQFQKELPNIRYYHIANSHGFIYTKNIIANVGRAGIALYGIDSKNLFKKLQPILSMDSIVGEIQTIAPNESVGYNRTFTAQHEMKIATIPVGYFEGVDLRLSNQLFSFLIQNKKAPIVGRVSMNMSSCNVTDILNVNINSPINIISDHAENQNSIQNIANLCNTSPYEILIHIPQHLHRTIV